MSAPTQTRQWILQNKPYGDPVIEEGPEATFKLVTVDLPKLKENQVLVKNVYVSNDPAQRTWISPLADPDRLYMPPVNVENVMVAAAIGEVIESTDPAIPKGTVVSAGCGWSEYAVFDSKAVSPIQKVDGVNITHFLGALGFPGFTAYYGITQIANTTKDDVVVISGAAGATGSMAVQIAKNIIGCKKVIGMAGTEDKCRLVEKLGADVCLNYKKDSFKEDLIKATEGYVDVYFDNVGGEILDLMLKRMKRYGRIAACGAISSYNNESTGTVIKNFLEIISMRITIKGFIVIDYVNHKTEMTNIFIDALKSGKLQLTDENETIVDTKFEDIPKTWTMLFKGGNTGKLVTKLKW